MENQTLTTALELASQGVFVYWLYPGSKTPPRGGEHNATTDTATVRQWFNEQPNANLGVNLKLSGLAVIDIDRHNRTTDGVNSWQKYLLDNDLAHILDTYVENTPRAGFHIFYKTSQVFPKADITLIPGVELLTDKVMMAPSYIDDYHRNYLPQYEKRQKLVLNDIQELPSQIIGLTNQPQKASKREEYTPSGYSWIGQLLDEMCQGASVGSRHTWLCHIMGKLKSARPKDGNSIWKLLNFANSNCDNPLPEQEIEQIFNGLINK